LPGAAWTTNLNRRTWNRWARNPRTWNDPCDADRTWRLPGPDLDRRRWRDPAAVRLRRWVRGKSRTGSQHRPIAMGWPALGPARRTVRGRVEVIRWRPGQAAQAGQGGPHPSGRTRRAWVAARRCGVAARLLPACA
jgi:hypothetical protein